MNSPDLPADPPPFDARMVSWMELKDRLAELHARLEYFRLMLKLAVRRIEG